jgi:hypothetical protein
VLIYNNSLGVAFLLSVIIQLVTAGEITKQDRRKDTQLCACVHEVSVNQVSIIILVSEDKNVTGNEEVSFYAHSVMLRLHPR